MNALVTESKASEVRAHDRIARTGRLSSVLIIGSVKSYLWSITNESWKSGDPNEVRTRWHMFVRQGRRWPYLFGV